MTVRQCLTLLALICATNLAYADVIGHSTLNGKPIVIDSDGTWKYSDSKPSVSGDCQGSALESKKLKVSLCVGKNWILAAKDGSAYEFQFKESDKDIFGGLITERTQVSNAFLGNAVLGSIAQRINKDVNSIPIRKKDTIILNGKQWNYVEFEIEYQGTKVIFADYYTAFDPSGVAQLLFWSSPMLFDSGKGEIEGVASTLKADLDIAK